MKHFILAVSLYALSQTAVAYSPFLRGSAELAGQQLYVGLKVRGDCPFSEQDARRVVDAELVRVKIKASSAWKDAFLFLAVTCIENEGPDKEIFGYSQFVDTSWCGLGYPQHLDELDSIMACDMESGHWQTRTAGRQDKAYLLDGVRKAMIGELQQFMKALADSN